jgi:hypothetical protein
LQAWVLSTAAKGAIPGTPGPTVGGAPQAAAQAAATTAATAAQKNAPTQPTSTDPVMASALQDRDYKLPSQSSKLGVGQSPAEAEEQKAVVTARNDLLKESQDGTAAAAQSLQYLQAAKSIMDSKGATVGAYGGLLTQASRLVGGTQATNYQELAKYLGNAALASAKTTYGAKMTQGEVRLQLEDLSPSTKMTDDAVSNLLNTNIAQAKYTIDSARRVRPFLMSTGDPRSFSEWNQQYFPREKIVNQASPQPNSAKVPAVGAVSKGYRYTGGDPSKPTSWAKVTP